MHILMVILQNLSPHHNHGGSSKNVKRVAIGLARRGHSVTMLCSQAADNRIPFSIGGQIEIRPTLPYRESWQDTFLVPPYQLASAVRQVRYAADSAHRIVIFDSHFLYPDALPDDVPLVWSLRDFTYVQALQGGFGFRRDIMITPSRYTSNCFRDALSGWLPGLTERLHIVPNGVDGQVFARRDSSALRRAIGLETADYPVLLYPHRPEDRKGINEALAVTSSLRTDGYHRTRLIIMRGMDAATRPEVAGYYLQLESTIADMNLSDAVRWCDWLPESAMPELYSTSDVTLCLGDIVEASSNTALESLACGTDVVASDIACYRDMPDVVLRVPPHDVPAALRAVRSALAKRAEGSTTLDNGHVFSTRRSSEAMVGGYCTLIETAQVQPPLRVKLQAFNRVRIAAWVSEQNGVLYNEYSRELCDSATLLKAWSLYGWQPFDAQRMRLDTDLAASLLDRGFIAFADGGDA